MKFRVFHTALVGLSLVAVPTLLAAAPVQTPLTDPAPEDAEAAADPSLASGVPVFIAALGALGAGIAAGVGGDDGPTSP